MFSRFLKETVSQAELDDIEKFADRLLNKFDVDIEFTKHFADRMNDKRNKPAITGDELRSLFQRMADKKGKRIKKHGNSEVILKDMQKDLNLPVVINWKNGEFEVVNKTIMRKKGFKSPDPEIKYEQKDVEDPCWDSHKQVGTKKKGGKTVPNYISKEGNKSFKEIRSYASGSRRKSIDESSKEGTIRIIDLGNKLQHPIRKQLGVEGLPNKGFQIQRMTKGKFVNQSKPYATYQAAVKVNNTSQHSLQFEEFEGTPKEVDKLKMLRKSYGSINKINPSSPTYKKMEKMIDGMNQDQLKGLAFAKIKFLSVMAADKLRYKHDIKLPFGDYWAESVDLDEGKLGDQWQKGAKSVKSGSFELIRGKSGVHNIMKSGKKIGTFSYDDEGDNFVANMKGERGQLVGNDIDTLISNFKEEVDLDEGKMKDLQDYVDQGKSAAWIAKKLGYPLKDIQKAIGRNESLSDDLIKESLNETKAEKIVSKTPAIHGGHFVVSKRDTSGMRGKQDGFLMKHIGKDGVVGYISYGSHPSATGALKFAKNHGIIEKVGIIENTQKFLDKTPNWGEAELIQYGNKRKHKEVGIAGTNNVFGMVLFELDAFDKKYIKKSNVKPSETVFRYVTKPMVASGLFSLVKINIRTGRIYHLIEESQSGEIDEARFETKGEKLKFLRMLPNWEPKSDSEYDGFVHS